MDNKRGIASGKLKGGKLDVPEFANSRYYETRNDISKLINESNNKTTPDFKRNVQKKSAAHKKKEIRTVKNEKNNKRYTNRGRKAKAIIAGVIATGIAVGGYIAWNAYKGNDSEQNINTTTPTYNDTIKEDKDINAYHEVLNDFKETYINAYNEQYGTDYSIGDVSVYRNCLENGVYETNEGKLVTQGSFPYETEAILTENGGFTKNLDTKTVVQLVINEGTEEEKIITYSCDTGDYIISGNSNNIQRDLEEENIPTLEKLDISKEQILSLANVIESKELGNNNLEDYIDIYEEIINQEKNDDGFEIGD